MSEAVLDKTEITSPEDEAPLTPNSTPESTPAEETTTEEPSVVDSILEGLSEIGTGSEDGKNAPTNGEVPPAPKALTPEEAREQGRRERDAELASQQTSAERERYIAGLQNVVKEVPEKLTAIAERYGMQPADVTELFNQFNRLNGAYKPLYDHAAEQRAPQIRNEAYQQAEAEVSKYLLEAVNGHLGESAHKAITEEIGKSIKTWPDMAQAIADQARKGYVPSKDYVSRASAKAQLDKIETALKERGGSGIVTRSLAELTGSTGPNTPQASGGTGRTGTKEWAETASIEELKAYRARMGA